MVVKHKVILPSLKVSFSLPISILFVNQLFNLPTVSTKLPGFTFRRDVSNKLPRFPEKFVRPWSAGSARTEAAPESRNKLERFDRKVFH